MSLIEILITPVYVFLFYLFVRYKAKNMQPELRKHFVRGFWIKIFASLLFMVYYTFLTGGDTRALYYAEGHNLYQLLLHDNENWKYVFSKGSEFDPNLMTTHFNYGYFQSEANFMVIRITALLSFPSFGYYTPIGLFFGMFAYSGLWKLFLFFYRQRPELIKGFAISILYFPSVVFWSSGLMKDSLCIAAMGWLTYSLYMVMSGKRIISNSIILYGSVYLLAVIKIYILLAYAPLFLLYLFLKKLRFVKINFMKYLVTLFVFMGIFVAFSQIYEGLDDELSGYAIENLASTVAQTGEIFASMSGREDAASSFNLGGTFDGTLPGLIKIAPLAVAATFFRPFIWETNKISQLMAALESIILIFFTIKVLLKAGPFRVLKSVISDPLILFCFLFAFMFGLFVGTSTLNFGTLVRYKIPCMPFYAIALFLLYDKLKSRQKLKKEAVYATSLKVATSEILSEDSAT